MSISVLIPDEAHTFPCSSCESVFIKKEHLDRHQKVHTEVGFVKALTLSFLQPTR